MKDRTIIVGITGGIAAYKAAALCSALTKTGADVRVIMTAEATRFIAPLTLQSLTHHPVAVDVFEEADPSVISHIHLADSADLIMVAPATANVIGKVAAGLADDMLTTTLLATRAPVLFAPAMNVHMYENRIVQLNIARLKELGYLFADPGEGPLACGYTGKGRLPEPEDLVRIAEAILSPTRDYTGLRVLVTAGGTHEPLDPVRFIGNRASGKMGFAIAEAAGARGASVTLIAGVSSAEIPSGLNHVIRVTDAQSMYDAVLAQYRDHDIVIKAAAVADYRARDRQPQKIKKTGEELTITLVRNPDILSTVGAGKRPDQVIVGFAAETENVLANAQAKLVKKQVDMMVANDVSLPDAGFEVDTNRVTLVRSGHEPRELSRMPKRDVAEHVLDEVLIIYREKRDECR